MSARNFTLKEARRLFNLGFAILWLHPKSKRPIGEGWTSGPKTPWEKLKESFRDNFNVGVRLGGVSRIEKRGFLTVMDVDVKTDLKRHRREAMAAARKVLGEMRCPTVSSGRGNGSKHFYFVTPKPFKTFNVAGSSEMVKVFMPSKKVSKRDLEELGQEACDEGYRISRAWEISLYSDGRQTVLPPSVHPDSGRHYAWTREIESPEDLPLLEVLPEAEKSERKSSPKKNAAKAQSDAGEFSVSFDETLDIRWLPDLSADIVTLILDGKWKGDKVSDESSFLMLAARGLISAGLERDGVLTVLTDKANVLGLVGYRHAQTDSRLRAAKWVWNYTVRGLFESSDAASAFANVEPDRELSAGEVAAQNEEMASEVNWKSNLSKTKNGVVQPTAENCKLILVNTAGPSFVGFNEFANEEYYLTDTPWESKRGEQIRDIDVVRIKFFCSKNFGVEFSDNVIVQTIQMVGDLNRFHPIRDFIRGLEWDGVPRIDTWLRDYVGAKGPSKYLEAVSRKVLVALVKRVFEPGCKFDHVLILEGNQGLGKSTLLKNLTDPWFTDQQITIGDKDSIMVMHSKWLVELGELATLNRSEIQQMKAFVSQATDRIRMPYGRRVSDYPRQCIFIGSTNDEEYLKDDTGNRRFWPVKCEGEINFEGVKQVRDQLFAEAFLFYNLEEPIYLEDKEVARLAIIEQSKRKEEDEIIDAISDIISSEVFPRHCFQLRDVAKALNIYGMHQMTKSDQFRISKALKQLGCLKIRKGRGGRKHWKFEEGSG